MPSNFAEAMFRGMDDSQQRRANAYEMWTAARERGEARGREQRLRDLSQKWYSTPEGQRGGLLPEIAGVSPQVAAGMEQQWHGQQDKRRARLGELSRAYLGQPDSAQKQAFYERFVHPEVSQMGFGDLGPYDEATATNVAKQIVSAMGAPEGGVPASIRELQYLQENPGLAELDMKRRQGGQQWTLADVPDGRGGTVQMERNPYSGQWRMPSYGGMPAPAGGTTSRFGIPETDNYVKSILGHVGNIDPSASPETIAAQVLPHLIQQESGGNPNAVSPKGARGYTQVMPATGRDPGFGVQPLQNDSPEENVRFGRDYLTAMIRRYPGRLDQALAAYNAGPGRIPVQGGSPQVAQSGGWGYTPPERKAQAVRTLTADEVRSMGFPAGSIVQQDTEGNLKTVYTPKAEEGGAKDDGLNDRQRVGVQGVQRNLIQYTAALTGLSPDDIRNMTADEIAQAITEKGGRFVQGGVARVMSNLPMGGETAVQINNSDILSFAQGAGAAWAGYENPTGIITNADRESATAQMPNPYDPPRVQAAKIKNFLELSGWKGGEGGGKAKGSPQPVRVRTPSDYNNLPSGSLYIAPDGSQRRKK